MSVVSEELCRLLERTNLITPFDQFIKFVERSYNLDKISSFSSISEGYEDVNVYLKSEKGEFVLKIFAKEKTEDQINSYVDILLETEKRDLPFPRLFKGNQGYLANIDQENFKVHFLLTYRFLGKNFEHTTPTIGEMKQISHILGQFNRINIPIVETYDSWGSKNLVEEYSKYEDKIASDIKERILPIVKGMKDLDMFSFNRSAIHGDLQRKHVLKNEKGEYCILDLGCARNDAKIFDLSIFLAWFCLAEDTWKDKKLVLSTVINDYTEINPLSELELASIPLLVKAAYAAYLLRTSLLIQGGDQSSETKDWHEKSKKMLSLCMEWDWKF